MGTIDYYNENAEQFYRDTVDLKARYDLFLEHVPEGGWILDAGCGSGRDSLVFLRSGYQVVAFDASSEMARLARELTGLPVDVMRFDELDYEAYFDGIWASASLLHVPRDEIVSVFARFEAALKPGGTWYASFKYGVEDTVRGQRTFTNFTERSFRKLMAKFPSLEIVDVHKTEDIRPTREGEYWLIVLMRRAADSPSV